jgi:hypothetical protein
LFYYYSTQLQNYVVPIFSFADLAGSRRYSNMAAATPKATIVNDIHVEQIDADVKPPKSNPERHKRSERDRNRLTLPETDFDESSES